MLPLIVGGFYALLQSEKKAWNSGRLFLSGLLLGLAFMYKFPAIIILGCSLGYLNWALLSARDRMAGKRVLFRNLALLMGFVLAGLPFVLIFWANGALRTMTDVIIKFVFSVYGQIDLNYLGIIKLGLVRTFFIAKENFILWLFMIASSLYIFRNDRRKENILIVLWGLAGLLFVASHKEFFGYHYLLILPPFSLLTGYGLVNALGPRWDARRILTEEWGKAFILLTLAANLAFFVTLNYMHYTKSYYYLTGKITQKEYYAFFNAYPKHDYSFPADYEAAQYISQHTRRDDPVYVLGGTDSVIFFLAQRQPASRFVFSWFLFSATHGRSALAADYRAELLTDLQARTPKYIVTIHALDSFREFPAIHRFLDEHYRLEKAFPDERYVYALRNSAASRP